MALIKRMLYFDTYKAMQWLLANIKVGVKQWFHVKIKLFFFKLGLHGTTSDMKENYLAAKAQLQGTGSRSECLYEES